MDWILIVSLLITQPDGRLLSMTTRIHDLPQGGFRQMLSQAAAPRTDGVRVLVADCVHGERR